jgi:hypothetical protein
MEIFADQRIVKTLALLYIFRPGAEIQGVRVILFKIN